MSRVTSTNRGCSSNSEAFTYDAASRLKTVSSNGVLLVTNFYDAKSRRVKKATPEATTTFFYDDWNLIEERIAYTNGTAATIRYYWGKDLSSSLQGVGGIGGLLCLSVVDTTTTHSYIPLYDNLGNVTRYLDENGNTVAHYTYDAFGKLIAQSGPLADFFRHRFSTKYFDAETCLYYYGYRFYHPVLMRWLTRDPLEELDSSNLYLFVWNRPPCSVDKSGLYIVLCYPCNYGSGFYCYLYPVCGLIVLSSAYGSFLRGSKVGSILSRNRGMPNWGCYGTTKAEKRHHVCVS